MLSSQSHIHVGKFVGAAILGLAAFGPSAAQTVVQPQDSRFDTHVVLLGTAGGRTSYQGTPLAGISSAVKVGDDVYLVDFGQGWLRRFFQAGLGSQRPGAIGLESVKAAFITHLHADHVVDYPSLFLFGASDGVASRKGAPMEIYGPGRRGSLVPVHSHDGAEPPVVAPANPTPGTVDMTEGIYQAFANDINDNIRDSRKPDPHRNIKVFDIPLPQGLKVDENKNPAPDMEPFLVYQDKNVKVTAILVDHAPVYPAFAYRFDTADGSVTFSGDTNLHPNLIRLARGSDVLVQEVIDPEWIAELFPKPLSPESTAKMRHLIEAHTVVDDIGKLATAAGVKSVLLTHLAPADPDEARWLPRAKVGFSGPVIVGKDKLWLGVGKPRP